VLAHAHAGGAVDDLGDEQGQGFERREQAGALAEVFACRNLRRPSDRPWLRPIWTRLMASTPPTRARSRPRPSIIPAASNTPTIEVEQAMTVEKAGMVGSSAGVEQDLAGDIAPGQVGDDRAPDGEVGFGAVQLRQHRLATGTDRAMAS
jgi:hypothetical protein